VYKKNPTEVKSSVANSVKVYPNPSNSVVIVSLDDAGVVDGKISIFSLAGICVAKFSCQETKTTLDTKNLIPGFYFIDIPTKQGKIIKEFTKNR